MAQVADRIRTKMSADLHTSKALHRAATISAIIIAKNNERTISRCIESVRWANEIIVLDGGSTDRTAEKCRALGAVVHVRTDWPGYGAQKNSALELASGDWILSIDTDEWVTEELRSEIEGVVASPRHYAAYAMPRRSSFCGRLMRHSGWWPDYVVRLFLRDSARFSADAVHERLVVEGNTGRLRAPLMHEAVTDLEQMISKINAYSTASARMKQSEGRRSAMLTAILHGVWTFFRTYVLRLGFLDGREGFMLAVATAEGSYYRYAKLMYLSK
jgi:glycosyltransferase involved in cell wall biosynthesis